MTMIFIYLRGGQAKKRTLDFILDTASANHSLGSYLELLKVKGTLVVVGAPDKPMELPSFPLIFGMNPSSLPPSY